MIKAAVWTIVIRTAPFVTMLNFANMRAWPFTFEASCACNTSQSNCTINEDVVQQKNCKYYFQWDNVTQCFRDNVVDSCVPNFSQYSELCAKSAMSLTMTNGYGDLYKNKYCAMCNGKFKLDKSLCEEYNRHDLNIFPVSLSSMLDFTSAAILQTIESLSLFASECEQRYYCCGWKIFRGVLCQYYMCFDFIHHDSYFDNYCYKISEFAKEKCETGSSFIHLHIAEQCGLCCHRPSIPLWLLGLVLSRGRHELLFFKHVHFYQLAGNWNRYSVPCCVELWTFPRLISCAACQLHWAHCSPLLWWLSICAVQSGHLHPTLARRHVG